MNEYNLGHSYEDQVGPVPEELFEAFCHTLQNVFIEGGENPSLQTIMHHAKILKIEPLTEESFTKVFRAIEAHELSQHLWKLTKAGLIDVFVDNEGKDSYALTDEGRAAAIFLKNNT